MPPPRAVVEHGLVAPVGLAASPDGSRFVVWDDQRLRGPTRRRWRRGPIDAAVDDDGAWVAILDDRVEGSAGRLAGTADQAVVWQGTVWLRRGGDVLRWTGGAPEPVVLPGPATTVWATAEGVGARVAGAPVALSGRPGPRPKTPALWGHPLTAPAAGDAWLTDGPLAVRVALPEGAHPPVRPAVATAVLPDPSAAPPGTQACVASGVLWVATATGPVAVPPTALPEPGGGPHRVACRGDRVVFASGARIWTPAGTAWTGPAPVDALALLPDGDLAVAWADDRITRVGPDGQVRWTAWPHDPGEAVTGLAALGDLVVSASLNTSIITLKPNNQIK